jgi:N-methylhydantoinase A
VRERVRYALRYRGQSFELPVDASASADRATLRELFEQAHERAYGYRQDGLDVELVTVTVSVWGAAPVLRSYAGSSRATRARTRLWHQGRQLDAALIRGRPADGERIEGPAVCALGDSTLLITPGWVGHVLADATIELTPA